MRPTPIFAILAVLGLTATAAAQEIPGDYLPAIRTADEFDLVSASDPAEPDVRTTKFLLPAEEDPSLLGPIFQNVQRYRLHWDFLEEFFRDHFPNGEADYQRWVEFRESRRYFAGTVSRLDTSGGIIYGFTVFTSSRTEEVLSEDEVCGVYADLKRVFELPGLHYAPQGLALLAAREWEDPPDCPLYIGGSSQSSGYKSYTRAVGYGWVRIRSTAEAEDASRRGELGWRDIVVTPEVPRDIEAVVAGVITGEPQRGFGSHVTIRMARRGTPNAYVAEAVEKLKDLEDQLIRLEVCPSEYTAAVAERDEAETWWAENRPRLSVTPQVDSVYEDFDSLVELDLIGGALPPEARYGGKATNFARLERILNGPFEPYREVGFAIPMRYYLEFVRANRLPSALDAERLVTYEEYLEELFAWDAFQNDPTERARSLAILRDHAELHGEVDPALVIQLAVRIQEVFGSTRRMVRFRSSSNVEDALEFNGAGLYDSTSACAADDVDADEDPPSRCDSSRDEERNIARALKIVWASLWNFRAYEEREYYQVPQDRAGMGILVSRAFLNERANGIAFTGDPARPGDRRYVVTAQLGDLSVVDPDPQVTPERSLLELKDGQVVDIEREVWSSIAGEGVKVLSDEVLEELGALLWHLDREFPIELGDHSREDVLLDVEFKVESNGDLAVKQIRPFLDSEADVQRPIFTLEVPEGARACSGFVDGRKPRDEYAAKSEVRFRSGHHELPTDESSFPADLIEEVLVGPQQVAAVRAGDGVFRVEASGKCGGEVNYVLTYTQDFTLPGGEPFEIELVFFDEFKALNGEPVPATHVLDEEYITENMVMTGVPGGDRNRMSRYSSCTYGTLPLWDVRATLTDGSTLRLEERYRIPVAGSAPANLVGATLNLRGTERVECDYWRLVYGAQHHNVKVEYWVVLDPPIDVAEVGGIHVVELREPRCASCAAEARYLGANFETLQEPEVTFYWKDLFGEEPPGFRRGDADSSGAVNLTDAIFVLLHLFAGGAEPACPDAADFADDGDVKIDDAILMLFFLFRGVADVPAPGPFECGDDPTLDALGRCQTSCTSAVDPKPACSE